MGIEDAIEAAQLVKTKQVIGVHYDTFKLISVDKPKAIDEFEKIGLKLHLPKIGETIEI
jgi:L-ascorbate metabolism protein UlaG (beta-lactamase superfamily)